MKKIILFFIERSFLVNLISAFVILVGGLSFLNMRRDLIPTMKFNIVNITAKLNGASSIEMEKLVTFPIEENLDGLAGIEEITSTTTNNLTIIKVEFEAAYKNIQESVELIRARVSGIRSDLPKALEPIIVERVSVDSFQFLDININGISPGNDQDRAWVYGIKEAFRKLRGVVKINSSMPDRKVYIDFDLKLLAKNGLSVDQARAKVANYFSYSPVGSFSINEKTTSIELRYQLKSLADIKKLPLRGNESGYRVLLSDVANVVYRFPERKKLLLYDGHQTVSLTIFKDINSDAIIIRDQVRSEIKKLSKKLPAHIKVMITSDGAHFIEKQLKVLQINGIGGLIIVILSLFFLLGFRVAIMTAGGIPLAYFGTFIVLNLMGISINLISVVGMILVIGILVDDAIIVTENYVINLDKGLSPKDSALEAALNTIKPVTGTVITTAVAFSPILLIESTISQIFFSIPVVIITALALSWFESFFILPNHLAHYVKTPSKRTNNIVFIKLKEKYTSLLKKTLKWRYGTLLLLICTLLASLILIGKMNKKYNISVGNESLQVTIELNESSSLDETTLKLKPIHAYLNKLRNKDVKFINTEIGNVLIDKEFRTAFRFANIKLMINENHPAPQQLKNELKEKIRKDLSLLKTKDFKNISIKTKQNGSEDEDVITIFVSGGDKLSFEELQDKLRKILDKVPNVISLSDDTKQYQESWQFIVNKNELLRYKISSSSLAQQLSELFNPQELTTFRLNGESIELFTQYKKQKDITFQELQMIKIITPKGISIPVINIGNWKKAKTLKLIQHKNLLRKFEIRIKYDKKKATKAKVAKIIKKKLKPLINEYPAYSFTVLEASDQAEKSKTWLISIGIICLLLILVVLAICLDSLILPFIVMIPIPFGIIGIIFALFIHGMDIEIMGIIGLIGMAGVVVNDSLIMVDAINKATSEFSFEDKLSAIIEGSTLRFRSIILTTITTIGGVFPMAYGLGGESGFTQPLAFTMGWGLLFATSLTLFVLPSLLAIQHDFSQLSLFCKKKLFKD